MAFREWDRARPEEGQNKVGGSSEEFQRNLKGIRNEVTRGVTELALIDTQLFVYGTLAPGRANEHQLDSLEGTWVQARVRGYLFEAGWGAAQGFPGIRLDNVGPEVSGWLFRSRDLVEHWERLDRFEGPGYRRVEVTARVTSGEILPAYIYELQPHESG